MRPAPQATHSGAWAPCAPAGTSVSFDVPKRTAGEYEIMLGDGRDQRQNGVSEVQFLDPWARVLTSPEKGIAAKGGNYTHNENHHFCPSLLVEPLVACATDLWPVRNRTFGPSAAR